MLTTFDHDQYVFDALRAGARGFLLTTAPTAQLIDAIHIAAEGDAALDDQALMHSGLRMLLEAHDVVYVIATTLFHLGARRSHLLVVAGAAVAGLFLVLGIGLGIIDFAHFPHSHDLLAIDNAIIAVAVSAALGMLPSCFRMGRCNSRST